MTKLTTAEKIQVGGILLGLAGLIAGAVLFEPIVIGAGVIGAGTAAIARLSKQVSAPPPSTGTIASDVPDVNAVGTPSASAQSHEQTVNATADNASQNQGGRAA